MYNNEAVGTDLIAILRVAEMATRDVMMSVSRSREASLECAEVASGLLALQSSVEIWIQQTKGD